MLRFELRQDGRMWRGGGSEEWRRRRRRRRPGGGKIKEMAGKTLFQC
jgi:hypothetical protein